MNPFAFDYRGWTFNLYPTHKAVWQQLTVCIYYLIYFLLNFNLNFISSVNLGFGHCYISERSQETGRGAGGYLKEEERGKKEKRAGCLLGALFAIPFPMHLVRVCEEREQKGDGRLGPINNQ